MLHGRRCLVSCARMRSSQGLVAIGPAPAAAHVRKDHDNNEDEKDNAHSNGNSVVRLVGLAQVRLAKLFSRSEVEGLDSILGHFQEYPVSEEDGLVLTGVGVANGCLEEIQCFILGAESAVNSLFESVGQVQMQRADVDSL